MTDAAAVSIRNVSKTFGKGGTRALQGIELEFQPGEFISLIGPSGCGKSTLLRVIGDLIQPSEGEAVISGKSAHQARLDRDYGMNNPLGFGFQIQACSVHAKFVFSGPPTYGARSVLVNVCPNSDCGAVATYSSATSFIRPFAVGS